MFALCAFVAFEATAVTTVMPTVAAQLDGVGLYALSFAAPLASGVVGMVAAGGWSDRRGPVVPLALALVLFASGLVVCGLAPNMEVLVAGRFLQGLGGGALTVCLYVLVGLIFPAALQPAIFTSFAAAWVLPTLFGPALAAYVAHVAGWRWVFLGVVVMVAAAAALVAPALRRLDARAAGVPAPRSRLVWAVIAAVAVLALELLGSRRGALALLMVAAVAVALIAAARLVPAGTLALRRGLPAVIGTRGLLSGAFFCGETYIIFVLQERWGLSAGVAGLALTGVGLSWTAASWVQSRLARTLSDRAAMLIGSVLVLGGSLGPHERRRRPRTRAAGRGDVRPGRRGHGAGLPAHERRDARRLRRLRPRLQLGGALDRGLPRRRPDDLRLRRRLRGGDAGRRRPVRPRPHPRHRRGRPRGAGRLRTACELGVVADRS